MTPLFITGIGTGIGKTLVAAILAEVFAADYWKPVQAGFEDGTDSDWIRSSISNEEITVHPESYILKKPSSPHIAAREEGLLISMDKIRADFDSIKKKMAESAGSGKESLREKKLIIEGAGGLLVPLTESSFVADLIRQLEADVILVSRNYLGSINHSLLTAAYCKQAGIRVKGWIFNDQYLDYEGEIASWSGLPVLAGIPKTNHPDKAFIRQQAARIRLQPNFRDNV